MPGAPSAAGAAAAGHAAAIDTGRRDLDPSLDTAVYNCHCGYVFESPVQTSIDCPHCGDAQAW
jgi:hypothetical protein